MASPQPPAGPPAPRVAIIGGGPSGIATCRAVLAEGGLDPVVFERSCGAGGLWRGGEEGKVWDSLHTNLSKHTCAFSDAPWGEDAEEFPSGGSMAGYLEQYSRDKGLLACFRFRCEVRAVEWSQAECCWHVTWARRGAGDDAGGPTETEAFPFVVVASGVFETPHIPAALATFDGHSLHSSQYRTPHIYQGRRVLVVGAAFSGAEIASDLVGHAASVTVACGRRAHYYPPRTVPAGGEGVGQVPLDMATYRWANRAKTDDNERGGGGDDRPSARALSRKHAVLAGLDQARDLASTLPRPDAAVDAPFTAITSAFPAHVRSGAVAVRPRVVRFEGQTAVFDDGRRERYDAVILATGYRVCLQYLSEEARRAVSIASDDALQPLLLHGCVWPPPPARNIAFVGLYRGPFFGVIELQARWVAGVLAGRLPWPGADEITRGIRAEMEVRARSPRPQFPHDDYVGLADWTARQAGCHPATGDGEEIHDGIWDGPVLPFHFRLCGAHQDPAAARLGMARCPY